MILKNFICTLNYYSLIFIYQFFFLYLNFSLDLLGVVFFFLGQSAGKFIQLASTLFIQFLPLFYSFSSSPEDVSLDKLGSKCASPGVTRGCS